MGQPQLLDRRRVEGFTRRYRPAGSQLASAHRCTRLSLEADDHTRKVDSYDQEQVYELLKWSPPSLYLFRRGEEPRTQTTHDGLVQDLGRRVFGVDEEIRCYYLEFRGEGEGQYYRSVFFEG